MFNNTTDPTNNGASYIGSSACRACHAEIGEKHLVHGHARVLNAVLGGPPSYPAEATRAGVPDPPAGRAWSDVSYVIGGYTKGGIFLDQDGFVVTSGLSGVDAQWNLSFPANGTAPGFVPYAADATAPTPYEYGCFRCHVTGAEAQNPAVPLFQDGRPGIHGAWHEAGVQCESCHGPGSNHPSNPSARLQYVSSEASACGACHGGTDPDVIEAAGGFIPENQQWPELRASGGHAAFACTVCHDPHVSATYDRAEGLRNVCATCHDDQNMALHQGKVFALDGYTEELTCESCHMPFTGKTASAATAAVVGPAGRMGDIRGHIFRIRTEPVDAGSFFSADGQRVVKDTQGRAAVTVDFVCLRCHNGIGVFNLTLARAAEIAPNLHEVFTASRTKGSPASLRVTRETQIDEGDAEHGFRVGRFGGAPAQR